MEEEDGTREVQNVHKHPEGKGKYFSTARQMMPKSTKRHATVRVSG